jgi:transposase
LTVPEVRRLLLAITEPPERCRFRLSWSTFRRRHQAVAKACHSRRREQQQPALLSHPTIQRLEPTPLALTDDNWERIAPLLPPQKPPIGRPNNDHQTILAGMLWVARTGSSWRDLPPEFGPWETVHSRYQRWRTAGIWQKILEALNPPATTNDH